MAMSGSEGVECSAAFRYDPSSGGNETVLETGGDEAGWQ